MESKHFNILVLAIFMLVVSLALFVSDQVVYLSPSQPMQKKCPLLENCIAPVNRFIIRATAFSTTIEEAKQKSISECNELLQNANSEGNSCVRQKEIRCKSENCQFNAVINSVNSCSVECCWGIQNSEYKTEIYDVKCNPPVNLQNANQDFWICSSSANYFESTIACN